MIRSRLYIAAIAGAAIITVGLFQPAHAYSDNAAPAPGATPAAATADSVASPDDAGEPDDGIDASKTAGQNIAHAPGLSTFAKALAAAGLDTTLSGGGPLIVFAPDDAAFAKIPKDQLADLMKPENKDKLSKVLSYHLSTGNLSLKDIEKLGATGNEIPLRTLEGANINLKKSSDTSQGDRWNVIDENGTAAMITNPDQKTSNGKVYVIDTVLMPKM